MMRRTKEGCGGKAEWAIKAARQSFLQVEDLAGEEGKCRQAMDPLQGALRCAAPGRAPVLLWHLLERRCRPLPTNAAGWHGGVSTQTAVPST